MRVRGEGGDGERGGEPRTGDAGRGGGDVGSGLVGVPVGTEVGAERCRWEEEECVKKKEERTFRYGSESEPSDSSLLVRRLRNYE